MRSYKCVKQISDLIGSIYLAIIWGMHLGWEVFVPGRHVRWFSKDSGNEDIWVSSREISKIDSRYWFLREP